MRANLFGEERSKKKSLEDSESPSVSGRTAENCRDNVVTTEIKKERKNRRDSSNVEEQAFITGSFEVNEPSG